MTRQKRTTDGRLPLPPTVGDRQQRSKGGQRPTEDGLQVESRIEQTDLESVRATRETSSGVANRGHIARLYKWKNKKSSGDVQKKGKELKFLNKRDHVGTWTSDSRSSLFSMGLVNNGDDGSMPRSMLDFGLKKNRTRFYCVTWPITRVRFLNSGIGARRRFYLSGVCYIPSSMQTSSETSQPKMPGGPGWRQPNPLLCLPQVLQIEEESAVCFSDFSSNFEEPF
ncbi:hypothetical protein M9H77_17814 [Catharanthus roseus]|uniref:Uncharacterized protein n=1 Tax=Catharanthus roseus TaxID=4058 RepID=A0ACC0B5P8_CATRO|nr:hypothetical protein M9H77_17814 [Catharanthus roseus]